MVWFNKCPYSQLKRYKRREDGKGNIGEACGFMWWVNYHLSLTQGMNVESGDMHQCPTSLRHPPHVTSKVRGRLPERKSDRKDRGKETDGKKNAAQQNIMPKRKLK